jgi:UDP-N-acetylglucosamine:LPS N-acetylglucosamine transferase
MIWLRNRGRWLKEYQKIPPEELTHLFVGEIDDVLDRSFGFLLPKRRDWARKWCKFLGYIVRFDPAEYTDKAAIRTKLGYGNEPLIICATGGTCLGQELLELCGRAYPFLKKKMPDLRLVMLCGESYGRKPPQVPEGLGVYRYIPRLYEHFAASDLAIVVGGGSSTLELTALRRPFIYFPLKGQFDQQFFISDRLERHKAGIKMDYDKTTPEKLADVVLANIGKEATWPGIPTEGARRAAQLINRFL